MKKFEQSALAILVCLSAILPLKVFAQPFSTTQNADEASCATELSRTGAGRVTRDGRGQLLRGFDSVTYSEQAPERAAIVLETATDVYFYGESCDICAELYVCHKNGTKIENVLSAHSISCDDMPKVKSSDVLFSSCEN